MDIGVSIILPLLGTKETHSGLLVLLKAAFAPEIAILESPAMDRNVRDVLISAFDRHSEAIIIFRDNLNWFKKRRFNKVWKQYYSGHNFDPEAFDINARDRLFLDFFSIEEPEKPENIYLVRIDNILQYADK